MNYIRRNAPPTNWLVDGLLSSNEPTVIAGGSKMHKTTFALDLAVSLATQAPWLGHFPVSKRREVLYLLGEERDNAWRKANGLAIAKGVVYSEAEGLIKMFQLSPTQLSTEEGLQLIRNYVRFREFDVVIVDPLWFCLGGIEPMRWPQASDAIKAFVDACRPASTVIVHDVIKRAVRKRKAPNLGDMYYPGVHRQFGNFWMIGSREEYNFCLLYTSPSPRDRTRSRMPSSA